MKTEEIVESIENMTVKELTELVKAIEDQFDVSAEAVGPAAVPQAAAEGDGAEEEEEETIDLVLTNAGQKKIQVIKELKEITGKGLKECKALVDDLPSTIKEGMDEEDAESLQNQLEELGAEVELQ
ncbi:MAG: 50S ribosomal protein L7/L12 [Candidatus Bipolaricaulota bacterium]